MADWTRIALGIAGAWVFFGVCTRTSAPAPPGNVLLVGDSLFLHAADELAPLLEEDDWTPRVEAGIGAGITGGGTQPEDWPAQLATVAKEFPPEVVVIELGTNGCGPDCTSVPDAIDEVMEPFEDVGVVLWLRVRGGLPPEDLATINQELEAATDRWDNLHTVPYDRWMIGRPDYFEADSVHHTREGQAAFAGGVRDAIRAHTDV